MVNVRNLIVAAVFALMTVGCGGPLIELDFGDGGGGGGGGLPTPVPDGPTVARFETDVQPFINANGCGIDSCHGGSSPAGAYFLYMDTTDAGELGANQARTVCDPRLSQYDPPAGDFLAYFCDAAGIANAGHSSVIATAQDCTNFYAWAQEGGATMPPSCN